MSDTTNAIKWAREHRADLYAKWKGYARSTSKYAARMESKFVLKMTMAMECHV